MRIVVFLAAFVVVLGGLHYYVWTRLVRDVGLGAPWRAIATTALVVLAATIPASFAFRHARGAGNVLYWMSMIWLGLWFILVMTLVVTDVARSSCSSRCARPAGRGSIPSGARSSGARSAASRQRRRAASARSRSARRSARVRVKKVEVPLAKLPKTLDGVDNRAAHRRARRPDDRPRVPRGDRRDASTRSTPISSASPAISSTARPPSWRRDRGPRRPPLEARHVLHHRQPRVLHGRREGWFAFLGGLGIKVLANERVAIDGLDLAGVNDISHDQDIPKRSPGAIRRAPLVLLAHQPRAVREAARHGVDLQLSGHTHGGQIWPWRYFVYCSSRSSPASRKRRTRGST